MRRRLCCTLTDVCAEAWRDVERDGQGKVAGGRVQTGLEVAPVAGDAGRLVGPALELGLDVLLALQADCVLPCKRTHPLNR